MKRSTTHSGDTLCTPAMNYGKENEINAIRKFEYQTGNSVRRSDLYIELENCFLWTSPDGLIDDDDAIVQIKMIVAEVEGIRNLPFKVLSNGDIALNKRHECY